VLRHFERRSGGDHTRQEDEHFGCGNVKAPASKANDWNEMPTTCWTTIEITAMPRMKSIRGSRVKDRIRRQTRPDRWRILRDFASAALNWRFSSG
jgi:hypothetical protein